MAGVPIGLTEVLFAMNPIARALPATDAMIGRLGVGDVRAIVASVAAIP